MSIYAMAGRHQRAPPGHEGAHGQFLGLCGVIHCPNEVESEHIRAWKTAVLVQEVDWVVLISV
jgi:hypothetical protein